MVATLAGAELHFHVAIKAFNPSIGETEVFLFVFLIKSKWWFWKDYTTIKLKGKTLTGLRRVLRQINVGDIIVFRKSWMY